MAALFLKFHQQMAKNLIHRIFLFFATEVGKAVSKSLIFLGGVFLMFVYVNANRGINVGAEIDEFKEIYAADRIEDSIAFHDIKSAQQVYVNNQKIVNDGQDSIISILNLMQASNENFQYQTNQNFFHVNSRIDNILNK